MLRVVEITYHSKDFKEFQANMLGFVKLTLVYKKTKNKLYHFRKISKPINNQD